MTAKLEWPDREKYGGKDGRAAAIAKITDGWQDFSEMLAYQTQRADAAIARLRVAVDLLTRMSGMVHPITQRDIDDFFRDIGPIPGDTP